MLCNFCLGVFAKSEDSFFEHRNKREWEQSARSNCYICRKLLQKYTSWGYDLDEEYRELAFKFEFATIFDSPVIMLGCSVYGESLTKERRLEDEKPCNVKYGVSKPIFSRASGDQVMAFLLLPSNYINPPPPPSERPSWEKPGQEPWRVLEMDAAAGFPTHTGHPDVLDLAKRWLRECYDKHKCNAGRDRSWAPKRLLRITNADESGVYLVDTSKPRGKHASSWSYATVSYCWGTDPKFLKLTPDTFEELTSGVPLRRFPPTLRDAIRVVDSLNMYYVWIDSVCIMQEGPDSIKDWEEQAGMMKKIYSNSTITIGASGASSAEQGMFASRIPQTLAPAKVFRDLPGAEKKDKAFPRSEYTIADFDEYGYQISTWAIGTRGWIFQERLLTDRMLHFGPEQISWECKERRFANETFPGGLSYPERWATDFRVAPFLIPSDKDINEDGKETQRQHPWERLHSSAWITLVTAYSRLSLTYADADKLIALSGVAERVAGTRNDAYVAGYFRDTLPWALVWNLTPEKDQDVAPRSGIAAKYRAPSWSWAAVDEPINPFMMGASADSRLTTLATVEDVDIELSDPRNPFGRLESARLKLRGMLIHGRPLKVPERPHDDTGVSREYPSMIDIRVEISGWEPAGAVIWSFMFDKVAVCTEMRRKWFELPEGDEVELVTLLPIQEVSSDPSPDLEEGDTEDNETCTGLILVSGDDEDATYKRIGVFSAKALISAQLKAVVQPFTVTLV